MPRAMRDFPRLGDDPSLADLERAEIWELDEWVAERRRRAQVHLAERRLAAITQAEIGIVVTTVAVGALFFAAWLPDVTRSALTLVVGLTLLTVAGIYEDIWRGKKDGSPRSKGDMAGGVFAVWLVVGILGGVLMLGIGFVLRVAYDGLLRLVAA